MRDDHVVFEATQAEWLLDLALVTVGVQLLLLFQLRRVARDLRRLQHRSVVMCPARAIAAACKPDADA
jgi:hypothetical protein